MLHGVYVCTKNREEDVFKLLASIIPITSEKHTIRFLIADSTTPESRFSEFHKALKSRYPKSNIDHFYHLGGLPSARNACIDKRENEDVVHFFDDDVLLPEDYFEKVEMYLSVNTEYKGGGPRISGLYLQNHLNWKANLLAHFGLNPEYGKFTRSGRHYWFPDTEIETETVSWIPGCAMFFKPEVFADYRFNEQMENGPGRNYALGEDFDFTHRVSRRLPLGVVGNVSIHHLQAPSKRDNLVLIAKALGVQNAYFSREFKGETSAFKVYFGKILDFVLMSRPMTLRNSYLCLRMILGYTKFYFKEKIQKKIGPPTS
jgi:GT2 family glycosyltransferase